MAQKRKRPTDLPETVKQRATPRVRSAAARVVTASPKPQGKPETEPEETRAVLMSDPRDSEPVSPVRPVRPGPMVHQPVQEPEPENEPEDFVQNPEPYSWYESALSQATASPARGKVLVQATENGFDVISAGADVAVHYERSLPQSEPIPLPPTFDPVPSPQGSDIAPQMIWCAGGFLAALFLIWIAALSAPNRETIIITPGQTEVIRP